MPARPFVYTQVSFEPHFEGVQTSINQAYSDLLSRLRQECRQLGTQWVGIASDLAPRRKAPFASPNETSGEYAQSFFARSYEGGDWVDMRGYSSRPLGEWLTLGVKPHGIDARRRPYMIFFWERGWMGPGVYHLRHVNHPGFEGRNYLERSLDALAPDVEAVVDRLLSTWASSFSRGSGSVRAK